ncbi:hypothetical protein P8452_68244 [Trifolium repens]|nr:hypothetical protein P8452_68244 [Trifolium repens]
MNENPNPSIMPFIFSIRYQYNTSEKNFVVPFRPPSLVVLLHRCSIPFNSACTRCSLNPSIHFLLKFVRGKGKQLKNTSKFLTTRKFMKMNNFV